MFDMFLFKVVLLATLTFAVYTKAETSLNPSSGSEGDQYTKRGETRILEQTPSKTAISAGRDATDRTQPDSPNGVLMRLLNHKESKNSYSTKSYQNAPSGKTDRTKRSYYPHYTGSIQWPQFDGLNTWRPNYYPIQRPYFVPVYGYDGRIPLYYPQITYFYPGSPSLNPGKPPYVGPTYLPPVTTIAPPNATISGTDDTTMPIDDRFGDNDDDERPIWDNNGAYYPRRPSTQRTPAQPTRRPMVATSTFPPLVHKDTNTTKNVNDMSVDSENEIATIPPSIPRPQGPSKCVWAIVSCCSTASREVSYECFDQLGCGGPFWDVNPCDSEYAKAAIQTALNYYNSRS